MESVITGGVEEGVVTIEGKSFKLLLAVQTPKVITNPRTNPIVMAKKTSFFIIFAMGWRLTTNVTIVK